MSELKTYAERPGAIRACDWPGCAAEGAHRAPQSREQLRSYWWFCLEHVRAYNARWNYYAGMTVAEIDRERRRDYVWGRPTWPLGRAAAGAAGAGPHGFAARFGPGFGPGFGNDLPPNMEDPFGFFHKAGSGSGDRRRAEAAPSGPFAPGSKEAKALRSLEYDGPLDRAAIKAHYKRLAKRYHPDLNGGCKAAEERLKSINEAYKTVYRAVPA